MEPTMKNEAMSAYLERHYGRTTAITSDTCIPAPMGCGGPATEFSDELSRTEYRISGLCQRCQDNFFGDGTDE